MKRTHDGGSKVKNVWLDCDPGHDDAMAIILAGHTRCLNLIGMSTVAGNQTLDKTTTNALRTLQIAGLKHIDVVRGQSRPLVRPHIICPEIHGDTGLDGADLPDLETSPVDETGIVYMFNKIRDCSRTLGPVTLVATGCLTNVALLLTVYPQVNEHIDEIVLMGGAIGLGNTGPAAEFNIQIDPEAAKIVFESGMKVAMVPLEVTHTVLATQQVFDDINKRVNSKFGKLICQWLTFFQGAYKKVFGFDSPPLHDPCAVAYVIDPSLFETIYTHVEIDVTSGACAGRTVVDMHRIRDLPPTTTVCTKVDIPAFWSLMYDALERASAVSPVN